MPKANANLASFDSGPAVCHIICVVFHVDRKQTETVAAEQGRIKQDDKAAILNNVDQSCCR